LTCDNSVDLLQFDFGPEILQFWRASQTRDYIATSGYYARIEKVLWNVDWVIIQRLSIGRTMQAHLMSAPSIPHNVYFSIKILWNY